MKHPRADVAGRLAPAAISRPSAQEAPLYPTHPFEPFNPDSVLWVTPRHLAGDDGVFAERVGDALSDMGWRMWPTSRHTLLYVSPNELLGAEWIRASYPFELGGLPVAWQLSARAHREGMTEWNAYFTAGIPHEALVDLLVAVDAREEPVDELTDPGLVLAALRARGWAPDVDRPWTTVHAPGLSGSFSLEMMPPLIEDGDPRELVGCEPMGWQAWAEPVLGAPYLWCATFSPSVPDDLVAVFAASLSSSVPVPRRLRTLPQSTEGRLVVVRRS